MIMLYSNTGETWVDISFIIPASGQVTPVDGPVDWILGIWKTPFQAADDLAVLGFAKFGGGKAGKVFLEGIGNVNKEGYHTIKAKILTEVGKTNFPQYVGTNPDIIGVNGYIHLKATVGHLKGKIFETSIEISKYFK